MRTTLLSLVCGIAVAAFADDPFTEYSVKAYDGGITVEDPSYAFNALVHADGWRVCGHPKGRASSRAAPPSADGRCPFTITVPDGPVRDLTGEVTATAASSGGVSVCYRTVPRQTGRVATISVQGMVRGEDFAGGRALFDGVARPLPDINEQERSEFGGRMRALRIESRDGAKYLDFAFPSPQRLSVMHNGGTPYYTIRLMAAAGETVVSGRTYTVSFTLRTNKRLVNANTPWSTAAGRDFVPLRIKPDIAAGSILDFTGIVPREPCGAHGRLVVKGDHFEHADKPGERVKFVGMNLHSYACYHTMEEARQHLWSHDHTRALHPETSNIAKLESTGDPLALASERALMCLFLRGDLPPLAPRASFFIPQGALDIRKPGHDRVWHDQFKFPDAAWFVRLGTAMDAAPADSRHDFVYPEGVRTPPEEAAKRLRLDELKRGGGAVNIDRARNAFTVSTPRTCGGAVERGAFTAGPLEVDVGNEITAFWASAMDGEPLATSERILLTHLPRMYNTGDHFADRAGRYMLEIGTLPYLVSRVQANVRLKTARANRLKVYALDTDGTRRAEIPARVDDGCLAFVCDTARDPSNATYLYEITSGRNR